jgi:hypothetical protein
MDDLKLGTLIEQSRTVERDAVHIAVAPLIATSELFPGQRINVEGKSDLAGVGIVDPFLSHKVETGERFWCFLYPGSITSLRHEWSHPIFDRINTSKSAAMKVLERYAKDVYATVEELIDAVSQYLDAESRGGGCLPFSDFSPSEDFWVAFEAVTGRNVAETDRPEYFSCAC